MKLEIGQFARLKSGYSDELGIGKIDFIANCGVATIDFKNKKLGVFTENIIKASYNIIDILEEGDYVNGIEIIKIYEKGDSFTGNHNYIFKEKTIEVCNDNYETIPHEALFINNEIETIVTKEQFEQMVYKVGDDKK